MLDADQVRTEVERARRLMNLLNDTQSRATIDQYVRELESLGGHGDVRYAEGQPELI